MHADGPLLSSSHAADLIHVCGVHRQVGSTPGIGWRHWLDASARGSVAYCATRPVMGARVHYVYQMHASFAQSTGNCLPVKRLHPRKYAPSRRFFWKTGLVRAGMGCRRDAATKIKLATNQFSPKKNEGMELFFGDERTDTLCTNHGHVLTPQYLWVHSRGLAQSTGSCFSVCI